MDRDEETDGERQREIVRDGETDGESKRWIERDQQQHHELLKMFTFFCFKMRSSFLFLTKLEDEKKKTPLLQGIATLEAKKPRKKYNSTGKPKRKSNQLLTNYQTKSVSLSVLMAN